MGPDERRGREDARGSGFFLQCRRSFVFLSLISLTSHFGRTTSGFASVGGPRGALPKPGARRPHRPLRPPRDRSSNLTVGYTGNVEVGHGPEAPGREARSRVRSGGLIASRSGSRDSDLQEERDLRREWGTKSPL